MAIMETAKAVPSKILSPKPKNSPTLFIGRLSVEFVFQYFKYSHGSLVSAKTVFISKKNATTVDHLQYESCLIQNEPERRFGF